MSTSNKFPYSALLLLSLSLICVPASAAGIFASYDPPSSPIADTSRRAAEKLSTAPEVKVENNVCHIRGAVWFDGKGPVSDEYVALVDKRGQKIAIGITDKNGFYEVWVDKLKSQALVLQEAFFQPPGERRKRRWTNGPVIVCASPTVEVGDISTVVAATYIQMRKAYAEMSIGSP